MLTIKRQSYFYKYYRFYPLAKICKHQSHASRIYFLLLLFRVSEINASLFGQKGDMWFPKLTRFWKHFETKLWKLKYFVQNIKLSILTANNPGNIKKYVKTLILTNLKSKFETWKNYGLSCWKLSGNETFDPSSWGPQPLVHWPDPSTLTHGPLLREHKH